MADMLSSLVPQAALYVLTVVATHLSMSLAQTVMHYKLGHNPIGGVFFRTHIQFHHANYANGQLMSDAHLDDDDKNTPYFFIPILIVGSFLYLILPIDFFLVVIAASGVSFYAHVLFDRSYHVKGSWLQRFAWFRRKQELHFIHHRHAKTNFGVVHFFWDKLLGTYKGTDYRSS
jgi:sterol desaturase/sphingolipid hydroxylase (fatty acid hydroxylase superfamily)